MIIYKNRFFHILVFGFIVLLAFVFAGGRAKAITFPQNTPVVGHNTPLTNSGNIYNTTTGIRPWLAVGVGPYYGPNSYVKAYSTTNHLTFSLTLDCTTANGNPGVYFQVIQMKPDESGLQYGNSAYFKKLHSTSKLVSCIDSTHENLASITVYSGQTSNIHPGYYVWAVTATMKTACTGPNTSTYTCASSELEFRYSVNSAGNMGLSRPIFGLGCTQLGSTTNCDPKDPKAYTAVYAKDQNPKYWDYAVEFAPSCADLDSASQVALYDMDWGLYGQTNLKVNLRKDDRNDSTFNWTNVANNSPPPANYNPYIANTTTSGTTDHLTFDSDLDFRYQLWIKGANWLNTMQIYLPFDQFDAQTGMGRASCIHATCSATPVDALPPNNTSDSVSVTVKNKAYDPTDPNTSVRIPFNYYVKQTSSDGLDIATKNIGGYNNGLDPGAPPPQTNNRTLSSYSISAHTGPKTVNYTYRLYDNNDNLVPGFTPCSTSINWQGPGPPPITTRPYFKFFGADVMAGGWFAFNGTCNTATPPYQRSTSDPTGGILGYEDFNKGGASSQYGAFALGQVEQNSASKYGFYSYSPGHASPTLSMNNRLTFANTGSSPGYFEGSTIQSHCIPDYYSQLDPSDPNFVPNSGLPSSNSYKYTNGSSTPVQLFSGPITVPAGTHVTIYIKGNVWINNDIIYGPSQTDTNTSKFALVVQGSIYIAQGVHRLDGLYVAEPNPSLSAAQQVSTDTGDIWTCHDQSTTNPTGSSVYTNCQQPLTINGAVVAKQVNFLRTRGDVASASASEDTLSGAQSSTNIAEIINFTPEMIVGVPFFNPPTPTYQIQSLISLPPLF